MQAMELPRQISKRKQEKGLPINNEMTENMVFSKGKSLKCVLGIGNVNIKQVQMVKYL